MQSWITEVLRCPSCRAEAIQFDAPHCATCGTALTIDEYGIICTSVPARLGVAFHDAMGGTRLRTLQVKPLSLAYFETPFYRRQLASWLQEHAVSDPVLDLGCGDGRFTDLLLDLGFQKIICTDSSLDSLRSLAVHLDERGDRERVVLIQCDVLDTPVRPASLAAILSIGVLYYLNEAYFEGLSYVVSLLQPGGLLMASEPDLEGNAIKALMFDGIDEFADMSTDHRFAELHDGERYMFRVFDREELRGLYNRAGLDVLNWHGLSIFPSLLVIGRSKKLFTHDDIVRRERAIVRTFDYFDQHGQVFKHIIWLLKKRA